MGSSPWVHNINYYFFYVFKFLLCFIDSFVLFQLRLIGMVESSTFEDNEDLGFDALMAATIGSADWKAYIAMLRALGKMMFSVRTWALARRR